MTKINWEEEFEKIKSINKIEDKDVYDEMSEDDLMNIKNAYTQKMLELSEEKDKLDDLLSDINPKIQMLNVELSMIDRKLIIKNSKKDKTSN